MRNTTLCFLLRSEEICLPMKKRGFGQGRHNGYGGKQSEKESIEDAAIRELYEESKILINKENLFLVAKLEFYFPEKLEWNQCVHVYSIERWEGEPQETEEMLPYWFQKTNLPYELMWPDDPFWLPYILDGKYIQAKFSLGLDQNSILHQEVKVYDRNLFSQTF